MIYTKYGGDMTGDNVITFLTLNTNNSEDTITCLAPNEALRPDKHTRFELLKKKI